MASIFLSPSLLHLLLFFWFLLICFQILYFLSFITFSIRSFVLSFSVSFFPSPLSFWSLQDDSQKSMRSLFSSSAASSIGEHLPSSTSNPIGTCLQARQRCSRSTATKPWFLECTAVNLPFLPPAAINSKVMGVMCKGKCIISNTHTYIHICMHIWESEACRFVFILCT